MAITEKLIITGDSSQAVAATKKLDASLGKTFAAAQLGAVAVTKAFGAINKVFGDAVDNAAAYLKSTEKLNAALRQQGVDVKDGTTVLNAQSAALQDLTGTSDDVIRSMQATALGMGFMTGEVDNLVRASFALSNAIGVDVNSALRLLSQATLGNAASLGRYLPQVRDLTKEQLKAGGALELVNEQMGAFLDINTRGFPGELVKLSNAFDDLTEAIIVRGTPESGKTPFGLLTDELKDLTTLVTSGGATDALLKLGDILTSVFFFVPGAVLANQQINEAIEERLALLKQQNAERQAAAAGRLGGGRRGRRGGGGVAFGDVQLGQAPGVEFGEVDVRQAPFLSEAHPEQFDALQQRIADGRAAIAQSNAERMADIAMSESERVRAVYEEQGQMLLQEQQQRNQMFARGAQQIASITASFITGALETLLEGGDFSEFVKGFLQATGQQLIASGIQHALQGAAFAFIPGFQASAGGLAAVGAAEIAAGTAMMAGQLAIPAAAKQTGGSSSAPAPPFGGGGVPSAGGGTGGEGRNITIVFNGPTTKPEVGLAIREALAEAEAVGV